MMETILDILLFVHACAGFVSLIAAFIAVLSKTLNAAHKLHVFSGRTFFWGMAAIFLTAVPISIITENVFLFLIAIFSFYLALSGWCFAKNRQGKVLRLDWFRSTGMLFASAVMALYGINLLNAQDGNGYTMLVFAGIGGALSINDLRIIFSGGVVGPARIANHLTMMIAASIATITAFLLVNITYEPAYVVWLAPTVVITPIIVIWNFRIRRGVVPKGMP